MNKSKSIFVTALIALMLAAIEIGLYMLESKAYVILAVLLGVYGYLCGAANFCRWLGKETPLLPPRTPEIQEEIWKPDESYTGTYDDIKAELENPLGGGNA